MSRRRRLSKTLSWMKMKIRERYKRLTIWNKLAVWGSLASIISVAISLVPFFTEPDLKVEINWDDIESEIRENEERSLATRTFQLLNEKGASITLGPCPGGKCLNFELGELYEEDNSLFQTIKITGGGISFYSENIEKDNGKKAYIFGIADDFIIKNTKGSVRLSLRKEVFIDIGLIRSAEIQMITRDYLIIFKLLDVKVDSLKLKLTVERKN